MPRPFLDRITRAPLPHDLRALDIARARLRDALGRDAALAQAAALIDADPGAKALFDGVFGNSPFLTRIALSQMGWLASALAQPPEQVLDGLRAELGEAEAVEVSAAMRILRRARSRAALLIALADLAGVFSLEEVTQSLSRFADAAVTAALRNSLRSAAQKAQFLPPDETRPEKDSGIIVLAMGKYGALELNYSSDIDLIVFFDGDVLPVQGIDPAAFTVRLVKDLVRLLQERTEDGYVFRVDLRLRPNGSVSPAALSVTAAELYYESAGQNWERAAMIKARPCAGDIEAGYDFLGRLEPYIWRKSLDYAAIEDIHSIKRQIHARKGHGEIAVAGHNLKLGRGGIREIEFFAQTQQLILGGRIPELRVRGTCEALGRLARKGLITAETRGELEESYRFLRTIEHRLQMIDDEQTHALPEDRGGLDHVARFAGYADTDRFADDVRDHLRRVQRHYARLFEKEQPLASDAGSLVFTGVEEDPETLETLSRMGFESAREISARIRGWHHGRIRATRSARARERLTKLVPLLLKALAGAQDPDAAFNEFARFVEALPAGVQLFSLLISNPWLLELLSEIFSLSPRLARVLAERPTVLDALINADFVKASPVAAAPDEGLSLALAKAETVEDALDAARIFAREQQFQIAVQALTGRLEAEAAGPAFTGVAEIVIGGLSVIAEAEMAWRYGRVPGAEWAVLALGKLGGREMTASSDLDLVFVYDFDPASDHTTENVKLHVAPYYARLGQRLISLLTVPTAEGRLYEVDMRLRPSGGAGPVSVTRERFNSYHRGDAWLYEQMALTRARVIAGSPRLGAQVASDIRQLLCAPRDPVKLATEGAETRERYAAVKATADPWALKHVRGGLVDLEYIAQVLQLALAYEHPQVLATGTTAAFEKLLELDLFPKSDMDDLIAASKLTHGLSQMLRIAYERERATPRTAAPGLKSRLAFIADVSSFDEVETKLVQSHARVMELYSKYVAGLPHLFGGRPRDATGRPG